MNHKKSISNIDITSPRKSSSINKITKVSPLRKVDHNLKEKSLFPEIHKSDRFGATLENMIKGKV